MSAQVTEFISNVQSGHFAELQKVVAVEFPSEMDNSIYFNTGCCGRKPTSVLAALARGHERVNANPCHNTFNDSSAIEQARRAVAALLDVNPQDIFLAVSTSNALQILLQSFLLKPGDELVTTDQEHGSLRTIARYLSERRGIVVRRYRLEDDADKLDSIATCRGILNLVNEKTKLVALSALFSYSGWLPDLSQLATELKDRRIPLLADCAHGPGQILCRPAGKFPLWVGSGHKWLGGPNGSAFVYVDRDYAQALQPVSLGDTYYDKVLKNPADLARLEGMGTSDTTRWSGLTGAIDLHLSVQAASFDYQRGLACYLRERVEALLQPILRVNNQYEQSGAFSARMYQYRQFAFSAPAISGGKFTRLFMERGKNCRSTRSFEYGSWCRNAGLLPHLQHHRTGRPIALSPDQSCYQVDRGLVFVFGVSARHRSL